MVTPSLPVKPAAGISDDDDDLWDFGPPGDVRTLEQSPARSSGNDDELRALPTAKRRKLLKLSKLGRKAPDLVLCDAENGGNDSDSDLEIVDEIKKEQAKGEFGELLDGAAFLLPREQKKISKRDTDTQLALLKNRAALEQAKRNIDAPLPEVEGDIPEEETALKPNEENEAEAASKKIVVKLCTKQQADPIKLRISKDAPFSKMFDTVRDLATSRRWITKDTQMRFVFDGDVLAPWTTAADMDVEDDCVIEVHW